MDIVVVKECIDWIDGLKSDQRKKVNAYISRLAEFGHLLGMPWSKHIEGPFFELRPTANKVEIRVFYALKGAAWLLTGGQKNGKNSRGFYEKQIKRAKRLWEKYSPESGTKKG